ncbi:MAG TPA: GDSL-type esterase/lipase family protein [Stellaceae bacterium]|nr:GDSL-type esterase/lipase family protein [Stellaceae bacterium]
MDVEPRRPFGRAVWLSLAGTALGIALLLQACFGTRETPPPLAAPAYLSSPAALAPFFAALAALDANAAHAPVRVLQVGDSHTANDSLSGRLRDRLQARFGPAGRGWLPAGVPFKYYRPHLVGVTESGWQHVKPNSHAGVALGLDASAAISQPPDAVMTVESTEPLGFDRFAVEFLTPPGGAGFTVSIDGGAPVAVPTAAPAAAIKHFALALDRPARRAELRASAGSPVVLLGWDVERHAAGVIYENHGMIGATIGLLDQMTPEAVAFELDTRRPALLIVAFGTNEGFDNDLDPERYAIRFRMAVEALQARARGAPVLILGPPDGNRAERGCQPDPCGARPQTCAWREPPKLAAVRDVQRRVAGRQGWAYWDWFGAMGGACSIDRMTGANPPLAMPDHVHLSVPGYQAMADLLFADLMRGYEIWKAQPRTS